MICWPAVNTGFSEVIGSWKIMDISFPRICCISRSVSLSRSFPSNRISPSTILPGGDCTIRRIEKEVTLFPQPDSPTMARVFPWAMEKSNPSTLWTTPSSV